ncbi:MAG: hypothetical protein QME82_06670 [Bacillota bacterium]|nr:hypothetical protein [Bacillota bacterium]
MPVEDVTALEAILRRQGVTLSQWVARQVAQADAAAQAPAQAQAQAQANNRTECMAACVQAVRDATRRALAEYARAVEDGSRAMVRLALLEAVAGPAVQSLTRIALNPKQAGHGDVYAILQRLWQWLMARPDVNIPCSVPERLARAHTWLPQELRLSELLGWVITGLNPGQPV